MHPFESFPGADNCMLNICANRNEDHVKDMSQHLQAFAKEGLRTLVFGYRILNHRAYSTSMANYESASKALVGRSDALRRCAEDVEVGLTIIGATAIEDRLQDEVPESKLP